MTAEIKSKELKSSSSCFLGCFGFSSDHYEEAVSKQKPKKRKWFSWARKKRSAQEKVMSDFIKSRPAVKANRSAAVLPDNKPSSTIQPHPVNGVQVGQFPEPEPAPDQVNNKTNNGQDNNILEKRKCSTQANTIDDMPCQEVISEIRKSTKSPDVTSTATTVLAPPPRLKKSSVVSGGGSKQPTMVKSDSIIGMSILLITLMIMLFWGKVCAIVCTCAWFYFVPRFAPRNNKQVVTTKTTNNSSNTSEDIKLNSEEYKKRVVLEGLLQRNHRSGFVI